MSGLRFIGANGYGSMMQEIDLKSSDMSIDISSCSSSVEISVGHVNVERLSPSNAIFGKHILISEDGNVQWMPIETALGHLLDNPTVLACLEEVIRVRKQLDVAVKLAS